MNDLIVENVLKTSCDRSTRAVNGGMGEDALAKHVNRLGVDLESKTDPSLGDLKELMAKLQKQR